MVVSCDFRSCLRPSVYVIHGTIFVSAATLSMNAIYIVYRADVLYNQNTSTSPHEGHTVIPRLNTYVLQQLIYSYSQQHHKKCLGISVLHTNISFYTDREISIHTINDIIKIPYIYISIGKSTV